MKFASYAKCIDKVMVDVIPLDIYGVILGNPFMWDKDGIYYRRLNKLWLVKDGKVFWVNAHKSRNKLPMVISGQVKHLINASKIFFFDHGENRNIRRGEYHDVNDMQYWF